MDKLNLKKSDFLQMGLLNLKPELRLKMYEPFIEYFEKKGISYSIADNDMHNLGNNKCCCGDSLIKKASTFNNTSLIKKYGDEYSLSEVETELDESGCALCQCNSLFTSNRQEGCKTVIEFYKKRFNRESSPFSPKFIYKQEQLTLF